MVRLSMSKRSASYQPDKPTIMELSSGGVVIWEGTMKTLLLHEKEEDRWSLPKGHVESGETLLQAAAREIREEAGLHELGVLGDLGEVTYRFYDPKKGVNVLKVVAYMLFSTPLQEVKLENIFDRYDWRELGSAQSMVSYDTEREALGRARGWFASPLNPSQSFPERQP
jgi:8-oxo-dGTP pyrophosphatase MutT (NUDIX family)